MLPSVASRRSATRPSGADGRYTAVTDGEPADAELLPALLEAVTVNV